MAGGPIKFTGQPLETAHDQFDLTQAQFAEVGSEIVKALQHFQVAQADIDQLVCLYQTSMSDVVSSPEGPRQVTPSRYSWTVRVRIERNAQTLINCESFSMAFRRSRR